MLPLQLAQETHKRNIFWAKGWMQLEETYDITLNADTIKQHSCIDRNKTLDKINRHIVELNINKAKQATFHHQYKQLLINQTSKLQIIDLENTSQIGWIIKVRGDLLYLNQRAYLKEGRTECSMCNLHQVEDTFHFVAVCPILKEFRLQYLGEATLSEQEFKQHLEGKDWQALVTFCYKAWQYRRYLVEQFNC